MPDSHMNEQLLADEVLLAIHQQQKIYHLPINYQSPSYHIFYQLHLKHDYIPLLLLYSDQANAEDHPDLYLKYEDLKT